MQTITHMLRSLIDTIPFPIMFVIYRGEMYDRITTFHSGFESFVIGEVDGMVSVSFCVRFSGFGGSVKCYDSVAFE